MSLLFGRRIQRDAIAREQGSNAKETLGKVSVKILFGKLVLNFAKIQIKKVENEKEHGNHRQSDQGSGSGHYCHSLFNQCIDRHLRNCVVDCCRNTGAYKPGRILSAVPPFRD